MSKQGTGFTATSFQFFAQLEQNNNTEWFNDHRATYDEYVRDPFIGLLEDLTLRLAETVMPVTGGKQTMFRINRDLRFTDDKRPYSESVSGLLTTSGTKDASGPLVYLNIDANGGRLGGGMHGPKAKQLEPVRRRIVDEAADFDQVLEELTAAGLSIDLADQVKTMPRGFADHEDHRHADIIRCKQLLAMASIPKQAFIDDTAPDRIVDAALGLQPLYQFFEHATE